MGFADKFAGAVAGGEEQGLNAGLLKLLKDKVAEKGVEVKAEDLNPELASKGANFLDSAKAAVGTFAASASSFVDSSPVLSSARDWMVDAGNAIGDKLKGAFGKATDGKADTMELRRYPDAVSGPLPDGFEIPDDKPVPEIPNDPGLTPGVSPKTPDGILPISPEEKIGPQVIDDGRSEKVDSVVEGLTDEEKAMLTEFATEMANKMMDLAKTGKEYGLSQETIQTAVQDMAKNYMSQMSPEQMTVMMGIVTKCQAAGLITGESTMDEVGATLGEVMAKGCNEEKVAEAFAERADEFEDLKGMLNPEPGESIFETGKDLDPRDKFIELLKKLKGDKGADRVKMAEEALGVQPEGTEAGMELPELQ